MLHCFDRPLWLDAKTLSAHAQFTFLPHQEYKAQEVQCDRSENLVNALGGGGKKSGVRKHTCILQCMSSRSVSRSFVEIVITERNHVVIFIKKKRQLNYKLAGRIKWFRKQHFG